MFWEWDFFDCEKASPIDSFKFRHSELQALDACEIKTICAFYRKTGGSTWMHMGESSHI